MDSPVPRVLIVAPGPDSAGGMNTMINTVMASGLSREFELRRLSLHRDGSKAQKALAAVSGFASLARALTRNRPDVVWVHATQGASIQRKSIAVILARAVHVPTIVHLHSVLAVDYLERAPAPARRLARWALESSAVVVVLDPAWIPRLNLIARADYRKVRNPVDVPPTPDRSSAVPGRIVQVGMLHAQKGVFTTLEAFSAVRRTRPDAQLHFVGDGPEEAALRLQARRIEVADAVFLHGWVSHERALCLVESSEAVVLPSEAEGLPIALLEAMARAVPVLASPVGGIRDLLADGECGVMVPVGDARTLASGLLRVLSEPGYASEIGSRGRRRVLELYSTTVFAAGMADVLRYAISSQVQVASQLRK